LPEEIHKDYAYEALSDERDVLKKRVAELEEGINRARIYISYDGTFHNMVEADKALETALNSEESKDAK